MNTMELYLADIRGLSGREEQVLPLLTAARRAAVESKKPEQDRLHAMAAGLLLRQVLGVKSDGDLRSNEFGKRELVKGGIHFNLSHGGYFAALAVFHTPVGVDIEPVREKVAVIPRRFLLADELAWLEEDTTPERFAHLWTRLESALKADGRGFGLEHRTFSVLEGTEPWHIKTLFHEGYVISCAAGEDFAVRVNRLSVEELCAV